MLKSYVSIDANLPIRLRELLHLYFHHRKSAAREVAATIKSLSLVKEIIESRLGCPLKDKKILEIGPGQMLRQYYFFAHENDVIGVDTDVISDGVDLPKYLQMLRHNGFIRAAKTIGRQMLGVDRQFKCAMAQQLGMKRRPPVQVITTDVAKLDLPDDSLDCIVSFSVFEHVAEPEAALRQISRLLKPGGISYISLHLYTSNNGCHDPRIYSGHRDLIPYWAHLRPQHQSKVYSNAYLNKISLLEWKRLFSDLLPGCEFKQPHVKEDSMLVKQLKMIRAKGDLTDYCDEELLTATFTAIWTKP